MSSNFSGDNASNPEKVKARDNILTAWLTHPAHKGFSAMAETGQDYFTICYVDDKGDEELDFLYEREFINPDQYHGINNRREVIKAASNFNEDYRLGHFEFWLQNAILAGEFDKGGIVNYDSCARITFIDKNGKEKGIWPEVKSVCDTLSAFSMARRVPIVFSLTTMVKCNRSPKTNPQEVENEYLKRCLTTTRSGLYGSGSNVSRPRFFEYKNGHSTMRQAIIKF